MTAPKPNAELAYRVLDHIDAYPEQWDQGRWIRKTDCGTAGCFAGWTCMLSGDKPGWDTTDEFSTSFVLVDGGDRIVERTVSYRAADLLGIDRDNDAEGEALFDATNTRDDLGRLVAEIFGPRPTGTGCRCDWLGEGTPEHTPSPLCRSLRPDADRDGAA